MILGFLLILEFIRNIFDFLRIYFLYNIRIPLYYRVCYLAGKLCHTLRKQSSLFITDEDELCVKIAGLCHDLGMALSYVVEIY